MDVPGFRNRALSAYPFFNAATLFPGITSCHMIPRNDITALVGATSPFLSEPKDLFRIEPEAQQHTCNILVFSCCYHSIALPFQRYKVWTRDFLIGKKSS